jgi:hypothetical protein
VALQSCLRLGLHRRRREREKIDKDTGYLKGKPNFQFQQEIRQYLSMTLSGPHNHFVHILQGLRRAKLKPLNYSQVTAVQQGPLEIPVAFLQRLKDGLQTHTNILPESQEEEITLKDKFLTQSTPDIHKKLQKLLAERAEI